jgi:hypothetical protein
VAFDPYGDLTDVWKAIVADVEVQSLMGWSAADAKAHVVKRRDPGALAENVKRITVFKPPSRRSRNVDMPEQLVEIDVYVPLAQSHVAQQAIGRVHALLHKRDVGQMRLIFDAHLPDMPTASGFYCEAVRFKHHNVI